MVCSGIHDRSASGRSKKGGPERGKGPDFGEGVEAGKSGKKSPAMCPADKERIRRTLGLPPVLSRSLNCHPLPLFFLYAMPAHLKILLLSFVLFRYYGVFFHNDFINSLTYPQQTRLQ